MTGGLFYAFLVSLVIGTVLTPFLMVGARRMGHLDQPGFRKVHKEPIARVGGIAFAVGALVACGYWAPQSNLSLGTLAASLIIVAMGSLDDFLDLRVRYKFGGQVLAAGVFVGIGHVVWQPFIMMVPGMELPIWLTIPLTMILLVTMTNAINLSDGLDGLAGGQAFLSFGLCAYLAYQMSDYLVLALTLPVMGGLLGFLRFNTFPARVFMGDGGSQFLGFFLGAALLILTRAEENPLSPLLVVFIIGLPLLDLVAVVTQRLLTGHRLFQADQEHIHHKFLRLGFSHQQVVLIIYMLQIGVVGLSYFCRWNTDVFLAGLYLLLLAGVGTVHYVVYTGRWPANLIRKWNAGSFQWGSWVEARPGLVQGVLYSLAAGMAGFCMLGVVLPSGLSNVEAYIVLGFGVLVIGGLRGKRTTILLITRMGLYLSAIFALYEIEQALVKADPVFHWLSQGFWAGLILGLVLVIHLDQGKSFTPNPMDYLLLFLALLMPLLLQIQVGAMDVGQMMAKLIVLFFVCEILLQAFSANARQLGYCSGVVLLGLGLQGWW